MPKSKAKTALPFRSLFSYNKTLLAVISAVVIATGGYLFYRGSHAAAGDWRALAGDYSCPVDSNGIPATIQTGSQGPCVRFAQYILKHYDSAVGLAVDGSFGSLTKAAVNILKKQYNLTQDGIMGPGAWAAARLSFNYAPSFLYESAATSSKITLKWNYPTDSTWLTGYTVKVNGVPYESPSSQNSFNAGGLHPYTTYAFEVISHDRTNTRHYSSGIIILGTTK